MSRYWVIVCVFVYILSLAGVTRAADWYVDDNAAAGGDGTSWETAFDNIQDAVTAASAVWKTCYLPTDTIKVKEGVYALSSPLVVNKTVIIRGGYSDSSNSTLEYQSEYNDSVIDGGGSVRCMTIGKFCVLESLVFHNGHTAGDGGAIYVANVPTYSCLTGELSVTITDCNFSDNYAAGAGGAIYDLNSSAKITGCQFNDNDASNGGAIGLSQTQASVTDCRFNSNQATSSVDTGGGAIFGDESDSTISNCLFYDNVSAGHGGAMSFYQSEPVIINCTIASNTATIDGGAIYNANGVPVLTNCILWANSSGEIKNLFATKKATATYCDIQGSYSGTGNINLDPKFFGNENILSDEYDYHLKLTSPCIDAGTNTGAPAKDIDGWSRPLDGNNDGAVTVDMGIYEKVYANVDPQVISVVLDPVIPQVGYPVTVTITVKNVGTTEIDRVILDWDANGAEADPAGVHNGIYAIFYDLAGGETASYSGNFIYTQGGHFAHTVEVDHYNELEETDETNNNFGPQAVTVADGEYIDFFIRPEVGSDIRWFGGDDRVGVFYNTGSGQSVVLPKAAIVNRVGFYFTQAFDYLFSPDGHGHAVTLKLNVRDASGTIIGNATYNAAAGFKGGWIMFDVGEVWLDADTEYIFTSYVFNAENNGLGSYIAGSNAGIWADSTGYNCPQNGKNPDMLSWSNWLATAMDYNLSLRGKYVEKYPGDLNDDRAVNITDLGVLVTDWLATDCDLPDWCDGNDLNWNGLVTLADYITLAKYWGSTWYDYDDLNGNAIASMSGLMSASAFDMAYDYEFQHGSVLVYRTSAGLYGKLSVNIQSSGSFYFRWITYAATGAIYSSGSMSMSDGDFFNIDLGVITYLGRDFTINEAGGIRTFTPLNGAEFYVLNNVVRGRP